MKTHLFLLISLSVLGVSAHAHTLEYYFDRLQQHPKILEIIAKSDSFQAQAQGELGLENPHFIIGIDNLPISDPAFDSFLPTSKVVGVQQTISSSTLRKANSDKYTTSAQQQKLLAQYSLQQLKASFITQLGELNTVKQLGSVEDNKLKIYQLLNQEIAGQQASGQAVFDEFYMLDIEIIDIKQRINDLKALELHHQEKLIHLVGEVPQLQQPQQVMQKWDHNSTLLYPLLIAQESVRMAQAEVNRAEAAFKPSYAVQALYKQRESSPQFAGDDWVSLQASISIPLWSAQNQTPKKNAAKAQHYSKTLALKDTQQLWHHRMQTLAAEITSATQNIELLSQKSTAIQKVIQAQKSSYETGRSLQTNVLKAQIKQLKIQAQTLKLTNNLQKLIAAFNSHIVPQPTPNKLKGANNENY